MNRLPRRPPVGPRTKVGRALAGVIALLCAPGVARAACPGSLGNPVGSYEGACDQFLPQGCCRKLSDKQVCRLAYITTCSDGGTTQYCCPVNGICAGGGGECSTTPTTLSCSTGFANCSGGQVDGCEADLASLSDCGGCGMACSTANITPACVDGACEGGVCAVGYADCNANKRDDGCETETTANPDHCGGCGMVCSGFGIARACVGSSCEEGICDTGFADCNNNKRTDGCEVDLNTDAVNCGACGADCAQLQKCTVSPSCVDGACVGTAKACPPSGPCKVASCRPDDGACVEVDATVGAACSTANPCLQNETCTSTNECVGTPVANGTPCAESNCAFQATCQAGACTCPAITDAGATKDQGSAGHDQDLGASGSDLGGGSAGGADKAGCRAAQGGAGDSPWVAGLLLWIARRRRAAA